MLDDGSSRTESTATREGELTRIIALSDGVFAFAMTLLVVSIELPDLSEDEARANLVSDVWQLWPQMLSFVIGFLVIGALWSAHRRLFGQVQDFDDRLVKLDIVLLMLVAFIPFPTSILGRYGFLSFPAIFYAVIVATISLMFLLVIDHLDSHREFLIGSGQEFDFAHNKTRHLTTAGIFLLSIPISWVLPGAGQLFWIVLVFNHRISDALLPHLPARFHAHDEG